jgi:hypothetical protein
MHIPWNQWNKGLVQLVCAGFRLHWDRQEFQNGAGMAGASRDMDINPGEEVSVRSD